MHGADRFLGPILVYLSPDPPTENSFVKIFEKGKYEMGAEKFAPGKWAITSELKANNGLMNVRIPAGLKAGQYVLHLGNRLWAQTLTYDHPSYLLRGELIALHEGDAAYDKNPIRGAQFYPNCVQIEVTGDGTVELPAGVSFPGAYKVDDPGILHDVGREIPIRAMRVLKLTGATGLLLYQDHFLEGPLHHDLSDPRTDGVVGGVGRDYQGRCRAYLWSKHSNSLEPVDFQVRCDFGDLRGRPATDHRLFDLQGILVGAIRDAHAGRLNVSGIAIYSCERKARGPRPKP